MDNKAFTLVEMLLVIAIFAVIFAFSLPITVSQVSTEKVQDVVLDVKGNIKTYQEYASIRKANSAYGVMFTATKITLFSATDCAVLTPRSKIDVNLEYNVKLNTISLGGPSEICFASGSFIPNNNGYLIFSDGNETFRMDISSEGVINYYLI